MPSLVSMQQQASALRKMSCLQAAEAFENQASLGYILQIDLDMRGE